MFIYFPYRYSIISVPFLEDYPFPIGLLAQWLHQKSIDHVNMSLDPES